MAATEAELKRWAELVEQLRGTCQPLYAIAEDAHELEGNQEFCEFLDSELMVCETCGWWAETHEVDAAGNCAQCYDEDGDDED